MSLSVRAEVTPVTLGMGVRVKLLPVLPVLPMNEWMSGNDASHGGMGGRRSRRARGRNRTDTFAHSGAKLKQKVGRRQPGAGWSQISTCQRGRNRTVPHAHKKFPGENER